jgi:hypothetical protein
VPTIRVMTWNAYGGDTEHLADAIRSLDIDITLLQEARNSPGATFYAPLLRLAPDFAVAGPFRENQVRATPAGQMLAPEPSQMRSYAVVFRTATVSNVAAALLDYTADYRSLVPRSAFDAAAAGFNLRPPLRITFSHAGTTGVVYNWHAPLSPTNVRALALFDGCATLASDVASGRLVVIGADMNDTSLAQHLFQAFEGLEDGYDHLLAANASNVRDLRTLGIPPQQITLLDALRGDAHYVVPAEIDYP